jgi:3-phosphoinositide dependent protein kinase-1
VNEFASRRSLTKLISQVSLSGGVSLDLVRYYMAELLSAVEFMHSKDIVHRDLKPENILISEDWHLKIVSFRANNE